MEEQTMSRKIEETAVKTYQKIERGVVGAYRKVEKAVVGTYRKVENAFVAKFLTRPGETVEEAKARLNGSK